jgi:Tfp pilus assembly protein PilN
MELGFDSDFFRQPEVMGVLAGLLVSVLILFVAYSWKKSVQDEQQTRISSLQQEIERTRPPSDTPETDWQRIMRETAEEQKVYWGARLVLLAGHLPQESWIRDLSMVAAVGSDRTSGRNREPAGVNVYGAIYASDSELNLATLGDYILECLDDQALMQGLNWWQIRSIARSDMRTIEFSLNSPG